MEIQKIISETRDIFMKSAVNLSLMLKIKTTELVLNLMKDQKNFGLFIIIGWQGKWRAYTDIVDITQDIFASDHVNVNDMENHADWYKEVESTVGFDGAILINPAGEVVHSGVILEGLRPKETAAKINPGSFSDLSEQFGFEQKVHSRHIFAITASHTFYDTTVFTVSEETGAFHIFEGGKIIYSTV